MNLRKIIVSSIAIAAIGLSILFWMRNGHQIGPLNALWGVIGGIIALIAAITSWTSRNTRNSVTSGSSEQSLEELAESVRLQWHQEAETRGLFRPFELAVKWSLAAPNLSDRPSHIVAAGGASQVALDLGGGVAEITDVFRQLPARRLVILGEPGSGKTIFLLSLTLELLGRRQPGEPVPVLFPVASWNPHEQHFHTWLGSWLEKTYAWLRSPSPIPAVTLAHWLVATGRVMPLLDGLDEMAEPLRPLAVRALSRAALAAPRAESGAVIITCRTSEYARIVSRASEISHATSLEPGLHATPLADAAVVALRPLEIRDVKSYLLEATPEHQADKWDDVMVALDANPSHPLAQALSTPLMTAMAREAYSQHTGNPNNLLDPELNNRFAIEQHLIDQLIPSVYSDMPDPMGASRWAATRASEWFRFLACHLKIRGTRNLEWWEFGTLVPRPLYWGLLGVFAGLGGGLIFDVLSGFWASLSVGGATAIAAPLAAPFFVGVSPPSVVRIRFWAGAPRFATGFLLGLLVGLILELVLGLPVVKVLVDGTLIGCAGGMACGLEFLLEQPVDTTKALNPLSLLTSDRTAVLIRVFGVGAASALALGLAIGLDAGEGLDRGIRVGIVVALAFTLGITVVVALRTTLVVGIAAGLTLGGAAGVVVGFAASSTTVPGIVLALTCGIWLWFVIALGLTFTSAWGSYLLGRFWASIQHELPVHLIAFLEAGHQRGILRQSGAVYQFRHAALQDRLAGGEPLPLLSKKTRWIILGSVIKSSSRAQRNGVPPDLA